MFLRLLLSVLGMFLMMIPGYIARRRGHISADMVKTLARLHITSMYPCLIFTTLIRNFTLPDLVRAWVLPTCSAGIMILGTIIGITVIAVMRIKSKQLKSSMLFQCTINNYSFLPLTIISGLFSSEYVAALILSTLGPELIIWTLGIYILSHEGLSWSHLRHLLSAPLLAMYAAGLCLLFMYIFNFDASLLTTPGSSISVVYSSLRILGQGTVPVALLIAGARIATLTWEDIRLPLTWVTTALRLVAIPLAAIFLLNLLPLNTIARQVLVVVAVMPNSLSSMVCHELFGSKSDKTLINGTVLLSHCMSLITIPLILAWALYK